MVAGDVGGTWWQVTSVGRQAWELTGHPTGQRGCRPLIVGARDQWPRLISERLWYSGEFFKQAPDAISK